MLSAMPEKLVKVQIVYLDGIETKEQWEQRHVQTRQNLLDHGAILVSDILATDTELLTDTKQCYVMQFKGVSVKSAADLLDGPGSVEG